MSILREGVGEDGELVQLEKVHEACYLVHAQDNTESPFEFSALTDAEQFMSMIARFRMKDRLEAIVNE